MLKKLKKIIVTALILGALCTSVSASELSSWAESDYISVSRSQIIPFSVGSQSMRTAITREQLCELIVNTYEKLSGKEIPQYNQNPFADCENQIVINAYGVGLVGGTGDDTFSPTNPVTREEMAKMIYNMLVAADLDIKFSTAEDTALKNYTDSVQISEWARPAMATMLNYSLMNGVDGNLYPAGEATCEQAIVAVSRAYRAFAKEDNANEGIIASVTVPTAGAVVTGQDVSISWTPVLGASMYKVVLRNASGDIIANDTALEFVHTFKKDLFVSGEYHITVSAVMVSGKEVFSVPVSFKYVNPELQALVLAPTDSNAGMQNFEAPALESNVQAANVSSSKIEAIFAEGEKYIGVPYLYGGTSPSGFDCSGFVQYVFKNNGISLRRTSRDQYANNGYSVSKSELKRGDLVFFGSGGSVSHVGIYAGNGQMLHSPSTGKTVTYTSIETNYYITHYIGAKRIVE